MERTLVVGLNGGGREEIRYKVKNTLLENFYV